MKISASQKAQFQEQGFLIFEEFFTPEEISDFQHTLRQLIRTALAKAKKSGHAVDPAAYDGTEFHAGLQKLESIDHFYVADIYDTLAQSVAFKRLTTKRETESAINQLMDRDERAPLYTYTCRCRIDPPKDDRRTYGWHQEVFYSIPRSRFLQTWAPLVDPSSVANGTVEVCVGSHREGVARQSWNEVPGRAVQIIVDEALTEKYPKQKILLNVGQLLIFDYRLFHRSGDNQSSRVRYSLVGMYHDADNPEFYSASVSLGFKKSSPREFFDETFGAPRH
ncbi:MAG: phytanoyl-CoA dioxygenase family protein [Gemmatimonadaceae bacterium]|nr:phytanoyl-CoA dioxygenase family protein [Gemmatimonadaceae bacterium]